MIKRHISKDSQEDSLEAAKKGVYVLIAAAVIMWLAPVLLIDATNPLGGQTGGTATEICVTNPDGSITCTKQTRTGNGTLVGSIVSFKNDAQTVAAAILDIMKYVLLVGAVAGIAVLRVRIAG